ncbi:CLUMA_CG011466, isoform A [Clunio marinus]|uniref:CLUMA_CG011466, isoform A n=1 Tax=Clunio marinus TaxID=568069 RepID=A0A1J1IEA4_9DIPT|nr:CLUMA_CG011466, isoform A [Clunio marinus]
MTFFGITVTLIVLPLISAARIQLIDITPEEAQRLITQQSLDLRYAKKLDEGSAVGRSYNGKIIDSDGEFTEETYEANQFHGQDGLGRAIFGYTDNNQARLEARNANGEVRGQYQYIDAWGNDIQVQYWVDSLGFHQTDNHPQYDLQPVTETPEVKQAREEHERLWKAAARLNGIDPDANGFYNSHADKLDSDENGELDGQVSNQHQSLARYPILPYSKHIGPNNAKFFGKVDGDSVIVESSSNNNENRVRFARQQQDQIEEVTSEPRGFFYSFDYPVPYIVERNSKLRRGEQEAQGSERISSLIDFRAFEDNKIEASKTEVQAELRTERPNVTQRIQEPVLPLEVHDTQTSPKQQVSEASESIKLNKVPSIEEVRGEISSPKPVASRSRGSVKFSRKS